MTCLWTVLQVSSREETLPSTRRALIMALYIWCSGLVVTRCWLCQRLMPSSRPEYNRPLEKKKKCRRTDFVSSWIDSVFFFCSVQVTSVSFLSFWPLWNIQHFSLSVRCSIVTACPAHRLLCTTHKKDIHLCTTSSRGDVNALAA